MKLRSIMPLACITLVLAGCGVSGATQDTATPTPAPPLATTATTPPRPTDEPMFVTSAPADTIAPVPPPTPILPASDLAATVVASLPITSTAVPGNAGIDGVTAVELAVPAGGPRLWAAWSTGIASMDREQHFLAVYTREGNGWHELSRVNLPDLDMLDDTAVRQVQVEPSHVWIELQTVVGAHSGMYELMRFDGTTLRVEVKGFSSSPGASGLKDLDGDGVPEVVLDGTDTYVFCYACGQRYFSFPVLRWDGKAMQEVPMAPVAESTPAGQAINRAVSLAQAGLWKDAAATLDELKVEALSPELRMQAAILRLHSDTFAEQEQYGPFPMFNHLFYGDYQGAAATLRVATPHELYDRPAEVISGTAAMDWNDSTAGWITRTTDLLIGSPFAADDGARLAAAHFLRSWALLLQEHPDPAAALAEIEQAARLAPSDRFYQECAAYLRGRTKAG